LAKIENTAENLSTVLIGVSLEAGKATEKISILARQLKKISLSLIMIRKEEAVIISKIRYIIYRLIIPKI
jgi:hypothetical protein